MPAISAVTTYLTFFDTSGSFGIHCGTLAGWKNNMFSIIGKTCVVIIVISNVFFYVGFLTMMKSKDQTKIVVKISVITGSVLLLCTPGIVFLFLPRGEDKGLNFNVLLPFVVKCILNPFLYVWRFADARFQLKMAFYFWNEKVQAEIEAARKNYYSSYQISTENRSHVDRRQLRISIFSNRVHCEGPGIGPTHSPVEGTAEGRKSLYITQRHVRTNVYDQRIIH
jgi:hypothetical protein